VEDTGIGIEPEMLEAIFAPFQQAGTQHHQAKGTGLGLTISKRLIELMGGTLGVESKPGQGSLFWIDLELPIVEGWSASDKRDEGAIIGLARPKLKALAVDDDQHSRLVLVNMLTQTGFEVEEAVDGQDTLDKAEAFRPDLILLDLMMPVMDGFEAARRIRQSPTLKNVTVIAVSAMALSQDRQKSLQAGCDGFVVKPVDLALLLQQIKTHGKPEWEWRYAQDEGQITRLEKEALQPSDELIAPPPEQVVALLELAKMGDIKGLRNQIAELDQLGEQYKPFANQLRRLAGHYQLRKIRELLEAYLSLTDTL